MITHFYESFFVTIFVGIIFVGFAKNAHDLFISRVQRIGQPAGNMVNEQGEGFPLVFSLLLAPLILLCRKMFLMLFCDSLGYTKIKSIPFLFEDVSCNFWIYTKFFLLSCEVLRTLANVVLVVRCSYSFFEMHDCVKRCCRVFKPMFLLVFLCI